MFPRGIGRGLLNGVQTLATSLARIARGLALCNSAKAGWRDFRTRAEFLERRNLPAIRLFKKAFTATANTSAVIRLLKHMIVWRGTRRRPCSLRKFARLSYGVT